MVIKQFYETKWLSGLWPSIIGNAKKYTLECINTGWIKRKICKEFEDKFSEYQGVIQFFCI